MLRPNQVCFMTETFPISQGQAIEDRRCPGTALCGLSLLFALSLDASGCRCALSYQAVTFALSYQAVTFALSHQAVACFRRLSTSLEYSGRL